MTVLALLAELVGWLRRRRRRYHRWATQNPALAAFDVRLAIEAVRHRARMLAWIHENDRHVWRFDRRYMRLCSIRAGLEILADSLDAGVCPALDHVCGD